MIERINLAKDTLDVFYTSEGIERCGFIDFDNKAIEVSNVSPEPEQGYMMRGEDVITFTETHRCWATWHTHPGRDYTANLSVDDYECFKAWPNLIHFIVGSDGVRCYRWDTDKQAVIQI